MIKTRSLVMLFVLSFAHFHCATFHADRLPEVKASDLDFKGERKTRIFSRWTASIDTSFDREKLEVVHASLRRHAFEKVMKESDCCVLVDSKDEADLILNIKSYGETKGETMFFAILTGASLYIIPSWVTHEARIEAQVQRKSLTRDYKLADSLVLVQWLPMIFALPFQRHSPLEGDDLLIENIYRTLLLKIKEDGLFKPTQDATAPAS